MGGRYHAPMAQRYLFYDDYSEGAHPAILGYVATHNDDQQRGYGNDEYCDLARQRIRTHVGVDADIHFVSGGTQTNLVALASMLRPHQSVIAPESSHISGHEAGAIEATGHQIINCTSSDGKLVSADIDRVMGQNIDENSSQPAAIFLTQATEMGTIYSKAELTALVGTAKRYGLITYLDGARLAVAVTAESADVSLADISAIGVDMFYIGGTKNGALCGEALVIANPTLATDFRYHLKQRGALLSKGRLFGQQFARFFDTDGLWFELGKVTNQRAVSLANGLQRLGFAFGQPPVTNQLFVVLPDDLIKRIAADYGFHIEWRVDQEHSVVRLMCSWATPQQAIDEFLEYLSPLV